MSAPASSIDAGSRIQVAPMFSKKKLMRYSAAEVCGEHPFTDSVTDSAMLLAKEIKAAAQLTGRKKCELFGPMMKSSNKLLNFANSPIKNTRGKATRSIALADDFELWSSWVLPMVISFCLMSSHA